MKRFKSWLNINWDRVMLISSIGGFLLFGGGLWLGITHGIAWLIGLSLIGLLGAVLLLGILVAIAVLLDKLMNFK